MHQKAIDCYGGSHGLREIKLLDSALSAFDAVFEGQHLYETDLDKISQVAFSLVANHPFVDGNKRIGVLVMLYLLKINGYQVAYTQDQLIELRLGLASGTIKRQDTLSWIEAHL
jgi:death-on-curing protein